MNQSVAVVTGASQGIGRATALRLARDFSVIVLIARNKDNLERTAAEVRSLGVEAVVFALDLRQPQSAKTIIEETLERFGRIDALLNIAGAVPQIDLFQMTDAQWDDGMALKLNGALNETLGAITPEVVNEYSLCFCCTSTIHASCEDFRASADIGLEMDEADDRAGNKIVAPVHVLSGAKNTVGQEWDILATWRAKATSTITGHSFDCGHFLQEERPEETLEELQNFFGAA